MRDPDFEEFIDEFGEATFKQDVPESAYAEWQGRLPDQLLQYWREEGWCAYQNGLFWTVNPSDYEDLVAAWLEGTPLAGLDQYHVIARSAFGDLFLCGEKSGPVVKLACVIHTVTAMPRDLRPKDSDELNDEIRDFFLGTTIEYTDLEDENGKPLFKRTVRKLGPLAADEMYGFEPAIAAGGEMTLQNLAKVKTFQHLFILRELEAPESPFSDAELERLEKRLG